MRYAVLYDQAADGTWGAVEAIMLWLEVARERHRAVPKPNTIAETVEVA